MVRPDYVLIVGHGRSGTNWLIQQFDLSPETFCRSEPDTLGGSRFEPLIADRAVVRADQELLARGWDEAVHWARSRMGSADRVIRVRKPFLYEAARRLGGYRVVSRPRYRKLLRLALPSLAGEEWEVPSWLGDERKLAEALPILKLVMPPGWASFVLRERRSIPVFHIIRHPGGYLNSWSNRYLASHDYDQVSDENADRLRAIVSNDPSWAAHFGDIEAMSIDESELWYWCYANSVIFDAGRGSSHYHRIIYEDLARNPVEIAKQMYDDCGLAWTPDVERRVRESGVQSTSIADAWRAKLSPEQQGLVERIALRAREFYPL
jgi:hypothetical protein